MPIAQPPPNNLAQLLAGPAAGGPPAGPAAAGPAGPPPDVAPDAEAPEGDPAAGGPDDPMGMAGAERTPPGWSPLDDTHVMLRRFQHIDDLLREIIKMYSGKVNGAG